MWYDRSLSRFYCGGSICYFALTSKQAARVFYTITQQVREAIRTSSVTDGLCVVFCMHTTAGITINENAGPDVTRDLTFALDRFFPDLAQYRHAEGNSAAHLKSSLIGSSVTVIVENGAPLLGTWQGIYFAEFDGPRNRQFAVKIIAG